MTEGKNRIMIFGPKDLERGGRAPTFPRADAVRALRLFGPTGYQCGDQPTNSRVRVNSLR